jgi:ribosomal protein S18 acetylase RimI-like enzyme
MADIVGFQRVADGDACAFCGEIDGAFLKSDDPMPLHNNCGCSVEPVTGDDYRARKVAKAKPGGLPSRTAAGLPPPPASPYWQMTRADQIQEFGVYFAERGDAVPGGYNSRVFALAPDGTEVGHLDYQTITGEPGGTIAMLEVPEQYRRQGYATKLVQYVTNLLGDRPLDWGYTTPEGTALKKALDPAERVAVAVADHGELGPVLVDPKQTFTKVQ